MKRRAYLAAAGTTGLTVTAGCAGLGDRLRRESGEPEFPFPPGFDRDGVTDSAVAFRGHRDALATATYTAELRTPDGTDDGGTVRSAGRDGQHRWLLDHGRTTYADLYVDGTVGYAGRVDDADDPARLVVGDWGDAAEFDDWLVDAVAPWFRHALELPYGAGRFEVRDDREYPLGVYVVEEPPDDLSWDRVDELRLAVDSVGRVFDVSARFTPEAQNDELVYEYDLALEEAPPPERIRRPEEPEEFPTFAAEFRSEGRVLALTNTGERPVLARQGYMEAYTGLGRREVNLRELEELAPGDTAYLTAGEEVTLSAERPSDAGSLRDLRGDRPPGFRYVYEDEVDHGGPYEVYHSTACDRLDC